MTKQGLCKTKHDTEVGVAITGFPTASCCPPKTCSADFPVELTMDISPTIVVRKTCSKFDKSGCKLTCGYNIHASFSCCPTISQPCPRTMTLDFPVRLGLDTKAECLPPKKNCEKECSSSSSSSSSTKKVSGSCSCRKCKAARG